MTAVLISMFLFIGSAQTAFLKPDSTRVINKNADVAGGLGGYEINNDIYALVQTVINGFLALIGVLLLSYLLFAGYKWMTAHGEEEKVTQAKDSIRHAIIGVIIIVAAYAISVFVMSRLEAGTLKPATQASLTDQAGEDSNSGINWRAADVIGKQN